MKKFLTFFLATFPLFAVDFATVQEHFYDSRLIEGDGDQDIMLCLHGYGMDDSISMFVEDTGMTPCHLVSFNFPDFGENINELDPHSMSFGTIWELKPAIDRLHRAVFQMGATSVHLYGFSAGGGAAANILGVLKTHRFQEELNMSAEEMDAIYAALEKGSVVLDCPLKSVDEICEATGHNTPCLEVIAERYKENNLRPIDSLVKMEGSKLRIVLGLQEPDAILSNRDDALYCERLSTSNKGGTTVIVIGDEGAHMPTMPSLTTAYRNMMELDKKFYTMQMLLPN